MGHDGDLGVLVLQKLGEEVDALLLVDLIGLLLVVDTSTL